MSEVRGKIGGGPRSRTSDLSVSLVFETSCQPSERDPPDLAEGGWIEHSRDSRPGYWLATRHLTARAPPTLALLGERMTSFPDGAAAVPVMRRPDRNLRATRVRPGLGSNRRQSCAQRSCHAYHSLTSNFAARIGK